MSRTKHGFHTLKGKHMSFKKIKRDANSKMRARSAPLCRMASTDGDIDKNQFPSKHECFDPWSIW